MSSLPSQELLKELLSYDPSTGQLTWKERSQDHFSKSSQMNAWNARWAGTPACANIHRSTGYLRGGIAGVTYLAHRIIWKLVTGDDPNFIDHIDGCPTNNRWDNLSNGTARQNSRNQKLRDENTSGASGVSWCRASGKWLVQVGTNTGKQTVGRFNNQEDAITARRGIERILGYTARHGT